MLKSQQKHVDDLRDEKSLLYIDFLKAKEEPAKINNAINKNQKAID
jgi:hypothetical protein